MSTRHVHIRPGGAPSPIAPSPTAKELSAKELEGDDPYELVGMAVPTEPGVDADRQLALAFVEEYALAGWRPGRVRGLFAHPEAGKAHEIWLRRAELIDELVELVFGNANVVGSTDGTFTDERSVP